MIPDLSVIVPTLNEAGNVKPLLERIERATVGLAVEVVFVDDSTDATPEAIERAKESVDLDVTVITRPPERRNGLGRAVVEGMCEARGGWFCVMDGDLQHPPEVIPQLLHRAQTTHATLVAASRLTEGGATTGLSVHRKLISVALALASRLCFPKRLRQVSDPLTGFFLVRRDVIDPVRLEPEGFKILLEVLVRSPKLRVTEIPFEFAERHAGESKANSREAVRLFRQMLRLSLLARQHFLRFVVVGLVGFVVNTLLMALGTEVLGMFYLLSAVVATQGSTLWNFVLTEEWVFRDRKRGDQYGRRAVSYFAVNNAALVVRGPLLFALVAWLGVHYLVANVISLFAMTLLRYIVSERMIWTPSLAESDEGLEDFSLPIVSGLPTEKL